MSREGPGFVRLARREMTMDTCVCQLGYVHIEVKDVGAWNRFACEILGLEAVGKSNGCARFRMDEHHHRLTLHEGERDDLTVAGWEVASEPALRAIARRFVDDGVDVVWGTAAEAHERGVQQFFTVRDPNGVANELYCGPSMQREPFRSPRGLEGFVAGRLGMGHVVLCVDDYDASLRFYRDGLGLKISDFIDLQTGEAQPTRVAFLHAGPRHHSLALVHTRSPKRLHHVMLQVQNVDDVGTTYDLCIDESVPIRSTLGRHTNDHMLSFYMESPSGFQVEFGHGGVEIDDETWDVAEYAAASIWGHRPPG